MINQYFSKLQTISLTNKYTNWYMAICLNAQNRASTRKIAKNLLGYVEKHHILPISFALGGKNNSENHAYLSAKEHYLCHRLLVKMLTGTFKAKMIYALTQLSYGRTGNNCFISIKSYEQIKKQQSDILKGKTPWNKGMLGLGAGRIVSLETRQKISLGQTGKSHICSKDRDKKISASHLGKIKSPEHQANITKALKGRKMPADYPQKISAIMKEKWKNNPKINIYHMLTKQNKKISLTE